VTDKERQAVLVDKQRCPRCQRDFEIGDLEVFRGMPECKARGCGQRWWAMLLLPGVVAPQLVRVFGDEVTPEIMRAWKLPIEVRQPLYWQIQISRAEYDQHGRAGSGPLLRFLGSLVPSVTRG
jgi:hypothetical protein